jgi:hypothetical protein
VNRATPIAASLLIATTFASPALAGDTLSIRDVAPAKSLFVLGADDIHGTIERLGPTAFGKLWADPSIADDVKEFKEALEKGLAEAAAEAGIAREDITWPSSAGLAVAFGIDEELGLPMPEVIMFFDWSKGGEGAEKLCDALLESMQKDAKEAGAEPKSDEIRGRRVVILPDAEGGEEDGMDGDFDDEFGDEFDPFGAMPDLAPSEFVMTNDKGRLLVASSMEAMDALLARVDGDRADPVGDSETFRGAMELAGGTQDIYAMIATEQAKPLFGLVPQLMLVEPLVQQLFGDIKAWSFGVHAKDGVFETCAGIYVPDGKVGLLSLVDHSTEAKAPPALVPSDALGFGRINVRFDRIVPMLDSIIGGMPPEQGDMIKPQLDIYRPALEAAFAAMGPEVYTWSSEPGAGEMPSAGVFAISMKNDKDSSAAVMDLLNLFPLGLQSRDFNGMTIMSDEFSPVAVGIGGGFMVLGGVAEVEQAMRSMDAKGETGLAADPDFAKAMQSMPEGELVGFGWYDTARQIESAARSMQEVAGNLGAMADLDESEVPGLGVGLEDVAGFYELMKPEVVKRCFGYGFLEFTATKSGYMTRYRQLPAAAQGE